MNKYRVTIQAHKELPNGYGLTCSILQSIIFEKPEFRVINDFDGKAEVQDVKLDKNKVSAIIMTTPEIAEKLKALEIVTSVVKPRTAKAS